MSSSIAGRSVAVMAVLMAVSVGRLGAAETVPAPVADTVRFRVPPLPLPAFLDRLAGPGLQATGSGPLSPLVPSRPLSFMLQTPAAWLLAPGATYLRHRLAAHRLRLISLLALPPPSPETPVGALVPGEGLAGPTRLVSEISNLDLQITGRAELGGDWTRFRPCDTRVQFTCDPGIIPRINPDILFGVRLQGTIAERLTLDVDFDQAREFSAANRIHIVYEGGEDEVLRRMEIGDVTFDLPSSRFLSGGIPAGNFGLQATGQLGPIDFQGVWAQQRGDLSSREFRLSGAPGQEGFVQVDTLVLDDADYVRGQFFFVVDPALLDDNPHIDILGLDPSAAPSGVAPGVDPIQVYRFEDDPVTRQQVEGLIQADAFAGSVGDRVQESGWFRYLRPGEDYSVHSSGLWLALRRPLRRDEMLAITYITALGDTVGTYNPERVYNAGGRPTLQLLKASNANHRPGRPTWDQEMHQVYRVSSSPDVDPASVELTISLGELSAGQTFKRDLAGEDITLLRLFGLDEESPVDVVDQAGIYKPAQEFFQDQPPVPGVFIVFPTLRPFQTPPPLESLGLDAAETAAILGSDVNATIYDAGDPFDRDNGGLYRLTIPFELRSRGVISSFSLGALGIRDGSERVFLGDRLLVRGQDYQIDYDIGQVTLIRPEALFAAISDPVVRASWEQKSLFQIAPTTVFGLSARYDAGPTGSIDLLALHQSEQSLVKRPQLGVEPASITLGGLNGSFVFGAERLDRLLENIPGLRLGGPSSIGVSGELAVSLPNPNTRTDVFLDDFDSANELPLSLFASDWDRGSAPGFRNGAESALPLAVDQSDVGAMTWQHTWVREGFQSDSVGIFEGFLPQVDIDKQIRFTGSQAREIGLLLEFIPIPATRGGRSWRSITTALSPTGLDLSKTEFLEFYLADGDSLTLIVDLGIVSEDAMFLNRSDEANGVKETGVPWGLGLLDQEADPRRGEIWSDVLDEVGVWGETCIAERAAVYRIGDERANCTRGNGRRDTEDLDGDGNLDILERYLRMVVRLDGTSPFLARDRSETGTAFRLYRIPLRGADLFQVPGPFAEADFRAVRHLRVTVTGSQRQRLTLARMRLVGSRWVKRAQAGVLRGIVGDTASGFGRAEVGPVSRLTDGAAYQPPPGVLEELDDPTATFGGQGFEFNEKGLKLEYEDVAGGDRAEVFNRFPQRPRDFLTYRQLRVWAVARRGDWGGDRPMSFFVKVGEDAENFYLFKTAMEPVLNPDAITPEEWLPEILVDFEEWIDLRRRAEQELILRPRSPTAPPLELWSADSTYAIVLKDRARAPNLAAVRELSLGVWNQSGLPTTGEVWINEIRLSEALRDIGLAGRVAVDLQASDVLDARITFTRRGALFRQLKGGPTFQNENSFSLNSTLRLERLMPAEWGVEIPVTLSYVGSGQTPTFLYRSDVRVDRLARLRRPQVNRTRVDVAFRKSTPTANRIIGLLLDGLEAHAGYFTASTQSVTAESEAEGTDARLDWGRHVGRRDLAVVPGFLQPVFRAILPGFLEERLTNSRIRWTPERFSMASSYARSDSRAFRFDQIVSLFGDTLLLATLSPRESLETAAEIEFRPFRSLSAQASIISTRDLIDPESAVADTEVQALLELERATLAGVDLGWETNRRLRTNVRYSPIQQPWLRADFNIQTFYASDRNANFVDRRAEGADTVVALERNVNGRRDVTGRVLFTPGAIFSALAPTADGEVARRSPLRRFLSAFDPINLTWADGVTSRFNRDAIDPGLGFQLGVGGIDGFRIVGGDTATTFTDRTTWSARGGAGLPLGLRLGVRYQRTNANTLDTRSDRAEVLEQWPDLTARITQLRMPDGFQRVLRQISLSSGFRRIRREVTFGGAGQQRRFQEDRQIPLTVGLTWGGSLATTYRGTFRSGEGSDPTGDTERSRVEHRVAVTSSFVPPGGLAPYLDRPITASLLYRYTLETNCRLAAGQADCVPFLDELIRSLNVQLDTSVRNMDLRLQLSYTDRQSFVGLKSGSTQFQFGVFGTFVIAGGAFPG
ncbi:MAG: hypothetical protein IH968_00455 [Gemmatimonadetes bacterium]|nr:hypothetical protein [Gemmatimonadota bacterium]